jgi:hypothetical protein
MNQNKKAVHAMTSSQASEKKLGGHDNERDFNSVFGDKNADINYSGPSSDCVILDESFLNILKKKLLVKGNNVSLKSKSTIQIHLGLLPELTNMVIWNRSLSQKRMSTGKICTAGEHGISFRKQEEILKSYAFWDKYLAKGEILCYRDEGNKWIFFNMEDVINFIISNFVWRLLETGRIKGDCQGKQYLTYEYRSEEHKLCFVLGAHGGHKGKEFIDLLIKNIPYVEEVRYPKRVNN